MPQGAPLVVYLFTVLCRRGSPLFSCACAFPVPQGVPKVLVTFDIDANGILKASSRLLRRTMKRYGHDQEP